MPLRLADELTLLKDSTNSPTVCLGGAPQLTLSRELDLWRISSQPVALVVPLTRLGDNRFLRDLDRLALTLLDTHGEPWQVSMGLYRDGKTWTIRVREGSALHM